MSFSMGQTLRAPYRLPMTAPRTQGIVEVHRGDGIYLLKRPEDGLSSLATGLVETHVDHPCIWETRQALETPCARLAATRATADDHRELEDAPAEMSGEIEGGEPGLDGGRRVHLSVVTACTSR